MDKISGLPDELLVKILSFLPTKVAVTTSVLSKRWQFLWMWLPRLDYGRSENSESYWRGPPRDFIDKNLPLHKAPVIESLRLAFSRPDSTPGDYERWIEIAVSRHVRELEVSYLSYDNENIFLTPSSLFTCNSLVILKLSGVNLMDVPSMVCLPSLKTLQLYHMKYKDEKSLQELLSICPFLEDLDVEFAYNDTIREVTVIVPSLQKLSIFLPEELYLDGYEIDTPSLRYLKLVDWNDEEHYSLFKNMPELREAYVDVDYFDLKSLFGSITFVKHLTMCASQEKYGDGFVFDQLEHLTLLVFERDPTILLSQLFKDSPNLRVLDISTEHYVSSCCDYNDTLHWTQPRTVPECLLSSLQIFNWSCYHGRSEDRDIVAYIMKHARHLKKATILAESPET